MKTVFALVATASALAATPALADTPAGVRLEGLVGYDKVSLDASAIVPGASISRDGVGFAVNLGYDLPISQSLSAGVDAEVGESSTALNYVAGGIAGKVSTGRDLYVGGRLTVAVAPTVNAYAKVGYTNARLTDDYNGTRVSENGDGVRLGVGAQVTVFGNAYALVEYRYSNYQDGFSRNQVLTGLGVRF